MADGDDRCHRQIIREAQRGDTRALHSLYQRTAPRLLGYVRTLVGPDDADDVASETWASILADLSAYRLERGDFHAWAAAIARHRAIDHLRRGGRAAVPLPLERLPQDVSALDTERDAVDSLATQRSLALIGRLPREQAAAVLLRVMLGMDAVSAGRVLRKQPGAVRTATHRGLRNLREQLNGGKAER
jgi:RNA polymerase sigma-70 factor (ECF subfamily)